MHKSAVNSTSAHIFGLLPKILVIPEILETEIDNQFDCSQREGE